jgi:type I restriction enzyme, S subunit
MSAWKEVMLQDVVTILGDGLHGTPKYDENGEYYFINGSNLSNGKIVIHDRTKKTTVEEYQKYKKDLNDRTILVSINGTLGNVALYDNEKCVLGKSACYFNVRENVDKLFVKYVVINQHFQEYISLFATGTTIKNVSLKTMREYPFILPPRKEQEAITAVLSALDDKIDLLHRQNKTLESMAQALFRHWFIDNAADDWAEGRLEDLIELKYGKGLKSSLRSGDGFPVVGSSGVIDYHSEFLVEAPGIVIGRKGTLGEVIYLSENFFPIDTTYFVKSKMQSANLYFEYFLLKSIAFQNMNTDSAVPGLNRNIALATEVVVPPQSEISRFNKVTHPLLDEIQKNKAQIATLEKLRDTLLPKLMSGQVRVRL